MANDTLLSGENAAYLEDLLARFQADPASVDAASRALLAGMDGVAPTGPTRPPRSIFHATVSGGAATSEGSDLRAAERQAKVARLINAYRVHGHWAAHIDPLDGRQIAKHPELDPAFYGLTDADMDVTVSTSPLHGLPPHATVRTILARLQQVYCGSVGVEFMNILDANAKRWVQQRFENLALAEPVARDTQVRMLDMLTRADGFERFLGVKFQGYKRFSLEGAESLIPLLDRLLDEAGTRGVKEVVLGMAHRGRLNVLLNILHKPPQDMLGEFVDHTEHSDVNGSGDVKYHLGYSSDYTTARGDVIHLSLAFNPSHLEAVNPVVEGRARAKQDRDGDEAGDRVMPLLVHGDAAFAGQGLNAEVLNLSGLPGYRTGGTVHVVVNNQVGFTTSPHDARSTPYCTDVARMLGIPIFHVNGEDPETVARVVALAMEWRQVFKRDVVIDLYCFRKHGHNEQDEPAFTQPLMYRRIGAHAGVREMYRRKLVAAGVITDADANRMSDAFRQSLDEALAQAATPRGKSGSALQGLWAGYGDTAYAPDTAVPQERLAALLRALNRVPEGFTVHPKLARNVFKLREDQAAGQKPLDWAAGELLAYATLAAEGARVRLSGQDCKRGTFSHRHAVLFDTENGTEWSPVAHATEGQAPVEVYNSLLSEAAVLGFEYGYSLDYPDALVLWEAQFGDFANGAQIIIDNFLVSGETKWNRHSGLVMLLPHGYEGQGPEHSSARIERFLQMAAQENIQCANCTTPAQIFHLLRRQVLRRARRPLIVFTPKSLLRSATSTLEELATGRFQEVIGDGEGRSRVVLCSGKVYYDLVAARAAAGRDRDVALVRVEQTYPFPLDALRGELAKHPGAELVWCQEEPRNMGPWPFVALELLEAGLPARYAGRAAAASPATGFPGRHKREHDDLLAAAIG
ncbi:MAG: hypothetical protein RLZZ299_1931 [Pseudomonadota bacterium]|jgi:2-oxoglutarate dehydrogenase E1 component